mgnify:CR=1 FL=1
MSGKREIVFDTETTGFDAKGSDRITEIGCVEVIDFMPTGETFHTYLDPQRDVPEKVTEITGLTTEFLRGKPLFADQAQAFLDFVGDSNLVAHNADFDRGFVNAELERAGYDPIPTKRFIDTLRIARSKFPGSPASLDALCKRFNISLTSRSKHGAIVDAELLVEVYLDLNGGRMRKLDLGDTDKIVDTVLVPKAKPRPTPLAPLSTEAEREAHALWMKTLGGDDETMIWQYYWNKSARG